MTKGNSNAIEENNTLMANGRKVEEKPDTFATFLWNRQKGTCLGRTAKSWCQITIFYLIFYSCLAAFWIGCLAIFLKTLDSKVPRFYGKGTIIGVNPGVGYQPWLKDDPDSTLIRFNAADNETYAKYVNSLNGYLEKYKNATGTRICLPGQSNHEIIDDGGRVKSDGVNTACRFDLNQFVAPGCHAKNHYGFMDGKPCIALSLNRLIGWRPTDYPSDSVPAAVAANYKKGFIAINCDGTYDPDQEKIGQLTYIPKSGIDGKYYPYASMDNYHQPIAFVKFENLPRNKVVLVECRAYAYNIVHDITSKLGLVQFELLLEDGPLKKVTTR